jgi:hypothetical protein
MEKIDVKTMHDVIVIELKEGDRVLMGSKLFCGCCGNILGIVTTEFTLPCTMKTFNESVGNKTFGLSIFGLYHGTCQHTMFTFQKSFAFVGVDFYNKKSKS